MNVFWCRGASCGLESGSLPGGVSKALPARSLAWFVLELPRLRAVGAGLLKGFWSFPLTGVCSWMRPVEMLVRSRRQAALEAVDEGIQ